MAGIGFELVKLLRERTYRSLLKAYGLTTLMGSGVMLFSLFSIGVICFFTLFAIPSIETTQQFLAIVIYLFSTSMILSSLLQFTFFRFIADLVFLRKFDQITPNYLGVLCLQLGLSLVVAVPVIYFYFSEYSLYLQILLMSNFIVLTLIWISIVILSGFKTYRKISFAIVIGYSLFILLHFYWEQYRDLNTLVLEFLLTQSVLLVIMLYAIITTYPTHDLIKFDFIKKEHFYVYLVFANFFYNLGFWIDKFLFWSNDQTGYVVFSPLKLSPIYDLPIFIAFMSIIPASSVFMMKMESQFAFAYPKMMETIFKGKPRSEIHAQYQAIVLSGKETMTSVIKTQWFVLVILFLSSGYIFSKIHIGTIYLNLLFVVLVGGSLQFLVWCLLSLMYYMTKYKEAMILGGFFFLSNYFLTWVSLQAGPIYYGYGLCLSSLISILIGFILLNRNFRDIEYFTFMMTD